MSKKIIIPGGSGYLGQYLNSYFREKGYEVIILSRHPKGQGEVHWDGRSMGKWNDSLEDAYAVINLAGKSVNCRYTRKNKALILSSRIESTRVLGEAIKSCTNPPKYWLNSSTATIYENTPGLQPANDEKNGLIGDDFSMNIAKSWEKEFFSHTIPGTQQTALRTAIVLGKNGGAFPIMLSLAKKGLCSAQAGGEQWVSWIHELDFARALEFVMEKEMKGVVNICSPHFIQNKHFNQALREKARPLFSLVQPKWMLQLGAVFIGTEIELILKSRKVYPGRLLDEGFDFEIDGIRDAFGELIG